MLSRPEAGWSQFSLDDQLFSLSYLTNVPCDWLDQAIHGLETLAPFSVHGFCEPGRLICTVSYRNCHIIFEDEDQESAQWHIAPISMIEFCQNLYDDLSNNLDAWSKWLPAHRAKNAQENEIIYSKAKTNIEMHLARLKELISKKQDAFDADVYFL